MLKQVFRHIRRCLTNNAFCQFGHRFQIHLNYRIHAGGSHLHNHRDSIHYTPAMYCKCHIQSVFHHRDHVLFDGFSLIHSDDNLQALPHVGLNSFVNRTSAKNHLFLCNHTAAGKHPAVSHILTDIHGQNHIRGIQADSLS